MRGTALNQLNLLRYEPLSVSSTLATRMLLLVLAVNLPLQAQTDPRIEAMTLEEKASMVTGQPARAPPKDRRPPRGNPRDPPP